MTDSKKIDIANFILIWITLYISFVIPFELFLFSYAVLGPLHYLTEINWLEKQNYFLKNSTDKRSYLVAVFVVITIISLSFLIQELGKWDISKPLQTIIFQSKVSTPLNIVMQWSYSALFIGFIFSIACHLTSSWINRLLLISISTILTILFFKYPFFTIWFGIFLPTIIHVFVFTIIFMWAGAKKAKSGWGYVNVLSMIFILVIIANKKIIVVPNTVNMSAINTFIASNFHQVNFSLNKLLGLSKENKWNYFSPNVWKVQVFIAFAYTYHFLNWFSKTSVINWHKVGRKKMIITIVLWIISITLYYINYRIGFAALFILSILHVILEFPLNITSIVSLMRPIKK